jgi:adenylyltransferase/sulfurtransferase
MDRYARQTIFSHIGREGQLRLSQSRVTIIGMGALGTVAANNLCRAGIGYIRMVDRDYVEITNLQRQLLYDENDAKDSVPKVIAAFNHLSKVNSEVELKPLIMDVNSSNIEQLITDSDLVLDATDNWEVRRLINEACVEYEIPWIYCGAIGSIGVTMNILPGEDAPCLRCFFPEQSSPSPNTCSTFGVLNMITNAIASVQTAEALKILLSSEYISKKLFSLDVWTNKVELLEIKKNPDCPVCVHKKYKYLRKDSGSYTTSLCGTGDVQVVPSRPMEVDFQALSEILKESGKVRYNEFTLSFADGKCEIMLFQDGRAIIKNAKDENSAKSIYAEYIGL